jgi:hypothetical protein
MKLVIAETSTSTWHYHLREVIDDEVYLTGGAPPALCGAKLGWDTSFPLELWNRKSHIPEHFCQACTKLSEDLIPQRT